MRIKLYNKLSFNLILLVSSILLINLAFHTLFTLNKLERDLANSYSQNAYNMSDIIKKSTRYSMLLDRSDDVHQIIKTIGTEKGVEKIRIYNKMGTIIFSTDSTEIHTTMSKSSESCIVCHDQGRTIQNLTVNDKIRIFKNARGERVMGLINPIYNDKDCSNSDCHAHPNNVALLGVLDVVISMKAVDDIIGSNIRNVITIYLIVTFIMSVFSWLFISVLVNRPMRRITRGIEELGKGNLNYRITIKSKNEFGKMATQFNQMSGKLDQAYAEIKQWSETLNEKVKEKTEELKKIYDQIIQIEKLASLGKLSATVAHELNNPLEGILTYSKLIARKLQKQQKENEYEKVLEYLCLISEESARCGRIVKDLLLFSHRGEDGFAQENLNAIVDKSILLINHHLEINKISLEKEYPDGEIDVIGDSQKIQQALISLLINAIEAMPNGGSLCVKINRESNTMAAVRIADQGYGISEKDLPHIFEPFYTTKTKAKGTGLGLAVAYGIIDHHKGKIEVERTSPEGTTFKITLPIRKNNDREKNEQ